MKKLKRTFLVLAVATSSFCSYAQTDGEAKFATATVTEEFCVTLDGDTPIMEYYEIDISHLPLESQKEANDRFGHISNNLLTYSVDYEAHKAYLHIHLDRTPEPKTITWWNDYIASLCGL